MSHDKPGILVRLLCNDTGIVLYPCTRSKNLNHSMTNSRAHFISERKLVILLKGSLNCDNKTLVHHSNEN